MSVCSKFQLSSWSRSGWKVCLGVGGGVVCKVIFMSKPTVVLRWGCVCRWGCDKRFVPFIGFMVLSSWFQGKYWFWKIYAEVQDISRKPLESFGHFGVLPLKVRFKKDCLPSKFIVYSRLSIKDHFEFKVVFYQRSSSIKSCLLSKVVFFWRVSFIKDVFHYR